MAKKDVKPNIFSLRPQIGPSDTISGKTISLNLKVASMFAVGDIQLTPTRYWAVVSHGKDENYYDIINKGLDLGRIVLGKVYVDPLVKDPAVLTEYWDAVRIRGKGKDTIEKLRLLVRKQIDRNYTIEEIANHIIEKEKKFKNRDEILKLMDELKKFQNNHNHNTPQPEDDVEGKVEVIVDVANKIAVPKNVPAPPKGFIPGTKTTEDALNDLLK